MDIDAHEHPRDSHALLKTEIWVEKFAPWKSNEGLSILSDRTPSPARYPEILANEK
jgi:hypothetical protein